jgi:hypothetical protein
MRRNASTQRDETLWFHCEAIRQAHELAMTQPAGTIRSSSVRRDIEVKLMTACESTTASAQSSSTQQVRMLGIHKVDKNILAAESVFSDSVAVCVLRWLQCIAEAKRLLEAPTQRTH